MKPLKTTGLKEELPDVKPQAAAETWLVDCIKTFWLQQLEIVQKQIDLVDAGDAGPDIIHDLRVAARRVTSLAKLCQPYLDKAWTREITACLRPVRKATNELRDIDVLLSRLHNQPTSDPTIGKLLELLDNERQARLSKVAHKLADKRFRKTLSSFRSQLGTDDALVELLREQDNRVEFASVFSLDDVCLALLYRQAAEISVLQHLNPGPAQLPAEVCDDPELLASFLAIDESTVHAIRLAFKDFRYVLEFLQPALEPAACAKLIRLCKQLQDQLGTIHDIDLAFRKLALLTSENPGLQGETVDKINKAWHEERQALLQKFLKRWYLMKPVWFRLRLQGVVPIPGTTGAIKVRAAN